VVHRHHLHTGLAECARRHGAELFIDARVTSIDYSSNPVKVTTEKGAEYNFDLLIGSDGLKSIVRKSLFPTVKPRAPTKNAAYRGIIPYEEVFAKVPEAKGLLGNAIDVWGSPEGYCISNCISSSYFCLRSLIIDKAYPISAGKDLNLVLSHHRPDYVEDVQEVDMNELRDFYKDYDPIIKKVIDLVPSSLRWPLMVTGPLESWSSPAKNVVLMGDAAHSMVNHMAQGAATSMEDGAFLGRVISEVIRGVITIPEAISIYEKTRMPRVWIKQQASFTAGEIYMCSTDNANLRDSSSIHEISSSLRNVTNRESPEAKYRSWNLWGYADSVPGIYAYDAEGDADNAVCQYLQNQGNVDSNTKVAKKVRDKWWSWASIEGRANTTPAKTKL
jgi:salicylate hydroxylase